MATASKHRHDLLVIGAGPGGYIAAIRAAQLGLDVACVDENEALGGTCLRIGCIPSKALLESSARYYAARHDLAAHGIKAQVELDLARMQARKDKVVSSLTSGVRSLFKKNKITTYRGRGRLAAPDRCLVTHDGQEQEITAARMLIATGSRPATPKGVELDGEHIASSTEALAFAEVPKRLIVIGAGYIGLELGSVWSRLGSEVVVLEFLDRILPGMDSELASAAQKIFAKQGLTFELGTRVVSARREGKHCVVEREGAEKLKGDRVLVAVGRLPLSAGLGLEELGVELDRRGFIVVDSAYQTTVEGVFAVGDVIGGPLLAHKAEDEGVACVEEIVLGYGHVNYDAIPGVVYTDPELAAVGKTEEQLQEAAVPYRKGHFPLQANARAKAAGTTTGFVKMLVHEHTDRILGVHILGAHAGDLIAEAAAAIEFAATAEDVARTSHAHPTLAEAVREAALDSAGRALNI